MSNLTEKAIKESFIKLLNERPLNKITVKDIVEDCGINRNSFYYHFQDIPSLVEEIVIENVNGIAEMYPGIESIEQCMDVVIQFAINNKRAAYHIYNSSNRNIYEHYLLSVCEKAVTNLADNLLRGKEIRDSDRKIIIRFYKCEIFGQIIDWMNDGMKEDIKEQFHRLCELRQGFPEKLIERMTEK